MTASSNPGNRVSRSARRNDMSTTRPSRRCCSTPARRSTFQWWLAVDFDVPGRAVVVLVDPDAKAQVDPGQQLGQRDQRGLPGAGLDPLHGRAGHTGQLSHLRLSDAGLGPGQVQQVARPVLGVPQGGGPIFAMPRL